MTRHDKAFSYDSSRQNTTHTVFIVSPTATLLLTVTPTIATSMAESTRHILQKYALMNSQLPAASFAALSYSATLLRK